jgi:glycosyltransferase involved in cell wall biosynthesis
MSDAVYISVVIPCYNGGDQLIEQLEALRQQEYAGCWEVLVVDNCSDDNTAARVEQFRAHLPNLRLVRAYERRNKSYARNTGVRAARAPRLAFIDADDIVAPGWLAAMAEALAHHHLVAGAIDVKTLNEGLPARPFRYYGVKHRSLGFLPYLISCNIGVSREAFDAVGGFDEEFAVGQDIDFSWRVQLKGYEPADAPGAVVHYRFRETVRASVRQVFNAAVAHVHLYAKFKPQGMPRSSLRAVAGEYWWLLRNLVHFVRRGRTRQRQIWLMKAAVPVGHLWGSIRYRRLYL